MSIHEKIIGLLELSRNNPSEEEAATAAAMASKLMARHNIQEFELGKAEKTQANWHGGGTFERDYFRLLASGCGQMYPVSFTYNRGGRKETYKWVGTKLNCMAAEETMRFWADQVESLYKINLPRGLTKGARAEFRKNFKRGCAAGIIQKARELKAAEVAKLPKTGTQLVVVEDALMKEIDNFMQAKGIRTGRSMKVITGTGYGSAQGFAAADAVQLQRRV